MKRYYKVIVLVFFLVSTLISVCQANILKTEINRTQILRDESFQLIITFDSDNNVVEPDLSPLKRDFIVLSRGRTQQFSVINGVSQQKIQLLITLTPKRSGTITIPALALGNDQTKVLKITVKADEGQLTTHEKRSTFLNAHVSEKKPYVQSEIIYTIKLYYSNGLNHGSLTAPKADDAVILRLGKDKHYQSNYHGKQYQVVERNYAIFPQHAGKLVIRPAVFSGIVPRTSTYSRMSGLMTLSSGRRIQLSAPSINLQVKGVPKNARDVEWFPAKNVELRETWSGLNKPKIGEPISRTIKIRAVGLMADQIPALTVSQVQGVNSYNDRPIDENRLKDSTVIGERTIKIAYIPKEGGTLRLPEIRFPWWNVDRHRLLTARLPAKVLHLSASQAVNVSHDTSKLKQANHIVSKSAEHDESVFARPETSSWRPDTIWFSIAVGLLVLWGMTLLIFLRRKKFPNAKPTMAEESQRSHVGTIKRELKKACAKNDYLSIRDYLLEYASYQYPKDDVRCLGQLSKLVNNPDFSVAIDSLEQQLFGKPSESWDATHLWQAFVQEKPASDASDVSNKSVLPPLYP